MEKGMNEQERAKLVAKAESTLADFEIPYPHYFVMEKGDREFQGGTIGGHLIGSIRAREDYFIVYSKEDEPLGFCMKLWDAKTNQVIGMLIITDLFSARNPDGAGCHEPRQPMHLRTEPLRPTGLGDVPDYYGFG
jgi:hypothetical protein